LSVSFAWGSLVGSALLCLALVVPGLVFSVLARALLPRLVAAVLLACGTLGPFYVATVGMRTTYALPAAAAQSLLGVSSDQADATTWSVNGTLGFCVVVMGVALVIAFIVSTFVLLKE
jgi:hypothetical protein